MSGIYFKVTQWRRKVEGIRERIGETRGTMIRVMIMVEAGGAVHRRLTILLHLYMFENFNNINKMKQANFGYTLWRYYTNYLADHTVLSYALTVPRLAPELPQLYRRLYLKPALPQN